jgi:hypothetical protein
MEPAALRLPANAGSLISIVADGYCTSTATPIASGNSDAREKTLRVPNQIHWSPRWPPVAVVLYDHGPPLSPATVLSLSVATSDDTNPPEVNEFTNVEYTWSQLRVPCTRLYTHTLSFTEIHPSTAFTSRRSLGEA